MRRRDVLATITGVGTALVAGCSGRDENPDTDIETPDIEKPDFDILSKETGKDPQLSDVIASPVGIINKNHLSVIFYYDVADHSKEYTAHIRVDSDEDTNETSKQLKQVRDWYPGLDGLGIELPKGAEDTFMPTLSVTLLEDGEEVDVEEERIRL
ncbi:hypothetical protein ACFQS4_11815 [Saliphagus sp. GCM10025317]